MLIVSSTVAMLKIYNDTTQFGISTIEIIKSIQRHWPRVRTGYLVRSGNWSFEIQKWYDKLL